MNRNVPPQMDSEQDTDTSEYVAVDHAKKKTRKTKLNSVTKNINSSSSSGGWEDRHDKRNKKLTARIATGNPVLAQRLLQEEEEEEDSDTSESVTVVPAKKKSSRNPQQVVGKKKTATFAVQDELLEDDKGQ
eukprot:GHVH01000732.1.p1 GENE.GHVH01000732.1~~GHVH01000732.1.p1  ORF type:complete len:144 (+),score=34.84 GHVH01000732.1:37-432(+)